MRVYCEKLITQHLSKLKNFSQVAHHSIKELRSVCDSIKSARYEIDLNIYA